MDIGVWSGYMKRIGPELIVMWLDTEKNPEGLFTPTVLIRFPLSPPLKLSIVPIVTM